MKARQTWIQKENPNQHRIEDEIGCGWLTFCLMITDLFQNKKKDQGIFSASNLSYIFGCKRHIGQSKLSNRQ